MKDKALVIFSAIIFVLLNLFIYSCTKTEVPILGSSPVPTNLLAAAKDWHAQKTNSATTFSINTVNYTLEPLWKNAKLQSIGKGKSIIIVASPDFQFDIQSGMSGVRKFVFTADGGKIIDGRIIETVGRSDYVSAHKDDLIENLSTENTSGFTGSKIEYDLNYKWLSSAVYENGKLLPATVMVRGDEGQHKLGASKGSKVVTLSTCYAYYYVKTDLLTGVETWTYLFTSCETGSGYGDGGGGGGGSNTSGPNIGVFGLNNTNAQISDDNFDAYLNYVENLGAVFTDPINTSVYVPATGLTYTGQITGVYYNGQLVATYFSPDYSSGPFQVGYEYNLGPNGQTVNTSTVIYRETGTPYLGNYQASFSPTPLLAPGGGASTMIEDPSNVDWSNEPDDYTLTDPNPSTYTEYQQSTPWPTVNNIIPFEFFVPYRSVMVNGVLKGVNCLTLSKQQIGKMGYTCSGYLPGSQTFQTYTSSNVVNVSRTNQAITYVIGALTSHIPVVVGIDAYPGTSNLDGITDHFVTIDGMGTDSKGKYFHFVDNSTNQAGNGDYYDNKLYYNAATGLISGVCNTGYTSHPGGHDYIVTQIRKSIKK